MIIVKLMGGLGNQFFQYAFAKNLAIKLNVPILLDLTELISPPKLEDYTSRQFALDAFAMPYVAASKKELKVFSLASGNKFQRLRWKIYRKYFNYHIVNENNYNGPDNIERGSKLYFKDYWQSEQYFKDIRHELLKCIRPKNNISPIGQSILKKIKERESISIHIRRGDYVTNKTAFSVLGPCPVEYYEDAISYITERVTDPYFFIFSDDIEWVRKNFTTNMPFEIIDSLSQEEDIWLMSKCKHNIIANSSFSWWAAWLNDSAGKIVVSPGKWFKNGQVNKHDIVPASWIKL